MKKVIRIPIFLFPWEIDSFQNLADRLKLCANFIKDDPDYNIIVDVTLNISDKATNWDNSSLKPEFFTSSFKSICSKLNHFLPTEYTIEESNQVFGCVDKRKESIEKPSDYILWLDPDIYFPTHTLYYMIASLKTINDDYFLISPQITKLWDNSWDVLTNNHYINDDRNKRKTPGNEVFTCDIINHSYLINGEISLKQLPTFKFSGGWFNLFSSKLLKKIGIPDSFGSYGLEDTFILQNCLILKDIGVPVTQYVLDNVIIGQLLLGVFGSNIDFKQVLDVVLPSKEEQKQTSISHFNNEITKNIQKFTK